MAIPFQKTFLTLLCRQIELSVQNHGIPISDMFVDAYAQHSPEDAKLWSELWTLSQTTYGVNTDLSHAIVIARAGGAKLVKSARYGYMIKPDYGNKDCYWEPDSYKEIQGVFRENEKMLLELLKRLSQ